jgi:hypothetical protein
MSRPASGSGHRGSGRRLRRGTPGRPSQHRQGRRAESGPLISDEAHHRARGVLSAVQAGGVAGPVIPAAQRRKPRRSAVGTRRVRLRIGAGPGGLSRPASARCYPSARALAERIVVLGLLAVVGLGVYCVSRIHTLRRRPARPSTRCSPVGRAWRGLRSRPTVTPPGAPEPTGAATGGRVKPPAPAPPRRRPRRRSPRYAVGRSLRGGPACPPRPEAVMQWRAAAGRSSPWAGHHRSLPGLSPNRNLPRDGRCRAIGPGPPSAACARHRGRRRIRPARARATTPGGTLA